MIPAAEPITVRFDRHTITYRYLSDRYSIVRPPEAAVEAMRAMLPNIFAVSCAQPMVHASCDQMKASALTSSPRAEAELISLMIVQN